MRRRHCLTALIALFLGVGATGPIALAQDPQEDVMVQQLMAQQPSGICRDNFLLITLDTPLLCIDTIVRGPNTYQDALIECRRLGNQGSLGRIATFDDLSLIYLLSPDEARTYTPVPRVWMGNLTGDDRVLCGNAQITGADDPRRFNFDGECNRRDRPGWNYFCAHDPLFPENPPRTIRRGRIIPEPQP